VAIALIGGCTSAFSPFDLLPFKFLLSEKSPDTTDITTATRFSRKTKSFSGKERQFYKRCNYFNLFVII